MRTINYVAKKTTASTEYRDIAESDMEWLFEKLDEITSISERNAKLILSNKELPRKGTGGPNSIKSAAEGILNNFRNGTQYNLSEKTCSLLVRLFQQMHLLYNDWDEIQFVETGSVKPLSFFDKVAKELEQATAEPVDTSTDSVHNVGMQSLPFDSTGYDIDTITITYKKKNGRTTGTTEGTT